jgi:hypothetical protein
LNPLSLEEKKALIHAIHRLPAHKMEVVLEIIQKALPASDRDAEEEIEVPLDALDTLTLRRLQAFIEDNCSSTDPRKKRSFGASYSAPRGDAGAKKARKGKSSSDSSHMMGGGVPEGAMVGAQGHEDDLALFDADEDDPLFATDSFSEHRQPEAEPEAEAESDAMMLHSQHPQSSFIDSFDELSRVQAVGGEPMDISASAWAAHGASDVPVGQAAAGRGEEDDAEEEDANLWSVAAAELRAKRPDLDSFG